MFIFFSINTFKIRIFFYYLIFVYFFIWLFFKYPDEWTIDNFFFYLLIFFLLAFIFFIIYYYFIFFYKTSRSLIAVFFILLHASPETFLLRQYWRNKFCRFWVLFFQHVVLVFLPISNRVGHVRYYLQQRGVI